MDQWKSKSNISVWGGGGTKGRIWRESKEEQRAKTEQTCGSSAQNRSLNIYFQQRGWNEAKERWQHKLRDTKKISATIWIFFLILVHLVYLFTCQTLHEHVNFLTRTAVYSAFSAVVKMPSPGWKNSDHLFQAEIRAWHLTQAQVHVVSSKMSHGHMGSIYEVWKTKFSWGSSLKWHQILRVGLRLLPKNTATLSIWKMRCLLKNLIKIKLWFTLI